MTTRIPVSTIQNKWVDAQRVDEEDVRTEQEHKNQVDASTIHNHFGSGVLLENPEQRIIFDSANLTSEQAEILVANNFDGVGLDPHLQPSDSNLGNQLEVELSSSSVFGRFQVKVVIIGLSFDDELVMDRFTFRKNEKQATSNHYKQILSVIFNDFKGNNNCSRNNGGRVVIRETAPFELSRDAIMVAQDVMPDVFFRDFKTSKLVVPSSPGISNLFAMLQDAVGPSFDANALNVNITPNQQRTIAAGDVVTRFGQKFKASTNNIQKVTLLMGASRDVSADIENRFDWSGDLIISIHKLQNSVNCPTDIVPELEIEFDPDPVPLVEFSVSQAELRALGYVLTDVAQPIDFVFNNAVISKPGGIVKGDYYVITFRRSGDASVGHIFAETGTDRLSDARMTIFTGVWSDVPEEDLWFQIWTDSSKVADGQGYDLGNGILYEKTTIDTSTGATIDNQERHFSFVTTGEGATNTAILQAISEESVQSQDEKTGNTVFSRQQFVPSFSFVTDSGLNTLKQTSDPLIIGCASDYNPKNNATLVKAQNIPGIAKGDVFCIVNPDADLLSLNLVGSKLFPNQDCLSLEYRIFKVEFCQDGYGDVNGDGYIDAVDVSKASDLIGEGLALATTQQKIVDGEIDTLELLRADVDGDGYVTASDVSLIQNYVDRVINSFPAGSFFTHLCLTVQHSIGRYDGYFDCGDGYIRLDGYSTNIVPTSSLSVQELIYDGYILTPSIEGADSLFTTVPFPGSTFQIQSQPFWQDYFIGLKAETRVVPQTFFEENKVVSNSCSTAVTFSCEDRADLSPECDPGRNDFYVPDNLIIGNGQIVRSDGNLYKNDLEIHKIILQLPQIPLEESKINVFSKLVVDRGDGFTSSGFPAARYADCSTVQPEDLALNRVRFGIAIQSFVPNLDGYSDLDGYGIIVDDIIGVHFDDSSGILSLSIKDLSVDPVFMTLVTKIEITVYLKKAGWNNSVLVVASDSIAGLISS